MEYKLYKKTSEVLSYQIYSENLVFKNKSKQLIFEENILSEDVLDHFHIVNNKLIFNRKNHIINIDFITKKEIGLDNFEILATTNVNNRLLVLIDKNQSLFSSLLNFEEIIKLEIDDYNWGKILVYNSLIIIFDKTIIHAYTLPTAAPLWHFDLSTLGVYHDSNGNAKHYEVYSFIGVLGDALFVKLNAHEIIVLDIHTGTLRERLQFVDEMVGVSYLRKPTEQMPFFNTKYIVNEKKSMIIGLCSDVYYEISYVNGKMHTRAYSMKDEYDSHNIEPGNISTNNVLEGDNLYFLAYNQGRFGILNTITKKITYISDPIMIDYRSDKFSQLKELQVSGDKVYVLSSGSTLHIFERGSS